MTVPPQGKSRVGWFVQTLNVSVASVRYRCFHMALALSARGVDSRVYTEASALIADMAELDAVVIVKRLDKRVPEVAAAAASAGKRVFLDLCDDLLSEEYRSEGHEVFRAVFETISPLLDGLVTTNPAMSDRILGYGAGAPPITEIPDLAETREMMAEVTAYAARLTGQPAAASPPPVSPAASKLGVWRWIRSLFAGLGSPSRQGPKQVVWFGNHGAPHSNFGMLSLIAAAPALRAVHQRTPLELVVVSNSQAKFDAFIAKLGVPARYVPWTLESVYEALETADAALLTNGDDDFSAVKSANRALQALACGAPVVATSNPALRDIGDCVVLDDFAGGLATYLRDRRAASAAVARGRALVRQRFDSRAAGAAWEALLRGEAAGARTDPGPPRPEETSGRVLFLVDRTKDLEAIGPLVDQARAASERPMIMLTQEAGEDAGPVIEFLLRERLIPTMASAAELQKNDARWLRAADRVVIAAQGDPDAPLSEPADALRGLAEANGVPVQIAGRPGT